MNSFKMCREKCSMTQKEVSIDLKVSIQAISYWETGERMPSYEKLFQLADLYKVSIDELLGRSPPSPYIANTESLFSPEETQLVFDFRKLSDENKMSIQKNVGFLLAMQTEEKDKKKTTIA
ncbi:MAG: helix-turn-helix transcriptional regulator [Clostridia bacterium]|nr:helix-turn-helix transcriptional regulator [Clostridia bacterium]